MNRILLPALLLLLGAALPSFPQALLQQNFNTSTSVGDYFNLTSPTAGQFNSIAGTAGAGVMVMDIASEAGLGTSLVLSRAAAGSVSVVRTTDLAASVGAVVLQMRFTPGQIKAIANSVLLFQLGTNFSAISQAETGGQVAAQIAVDLRDLDTAGDLWGWTGSPVTFNGFASNAFPLVTWAVNNSGGPVSYPSPNGGNLTLADGKFDLWVGDSGLAVRVFNGSANLNPGIPLRNFKLVSNDGNASYGLDEFSITKVAAEAQPTLLFNSTLRSASTTNGGTVTLSASVTGTGSLTYQWLRNGSMVPGATESQLVFSNFNQFSEGLYKLAVTGPAGSITSAPPALVISLPELSNSFAGSDGFDGAIRDTVNWGDFDFSTSTFGTALIQEPSRLVFSQNNTADAGAYRLWKKGVAPANQDWEARVQVELPNLAFATNGYVGAGLFVLNAADPGDRLNLEIETGKDNGFAYRDFYVTHTRDDVNQLGQDTFAPATNTAVLLRARWLAAAGTLLMEYDPDGPTNGENWVTLRSFSPGTNWGVNASGAFLVGIGASANNRIVNASEGVVLDSFATTVTPLPDLAWLPTQSTRDEVPFNSLGTVLAAPPGATNPIGLGQSANGTYRFGFFNRLPANPAAPTVAEADLTGSPLAAGTQLVLKFSKRTNDHVSFVAMTADAAVLSDVGYSVNASGNELTVRARVVNPVVSESNNPDTVGAAFGLLIRLAPTATGPENFRGTVFVTDMLYHDVEPPGPSEAAQTSTNYIGQMVSLAAKGISANTATFHAFIPERLFAAGRANGVDVTGENCLGYRTYVQLTGSTNGFFKLNSPPSAAFADANFDSDGDGTPDAIWRFKIASSTWSRQVMGFGKAESANPPTITIPPASLSVSSGSNATFSVTASGTAPLIYQWYRGTNLLAGATNATLTLTNVQPNQAGLYAVVVSNQVGSVVSGGATLMVSPLLGGTVVAWGRNNEGQSTVPVGASNVIALAAGGFHTLGLRGDGTLGAWGDNTDGQTTVPAGLNNVGMIAAGRFHSLALKGDGTVVAWGNNSSGQTTLPASLAGIMRVAAGGSHSVALKGDGTVVAWGDNSQGQTAVPAGLTNVIAISAGLGHTIALRGDGTVVAWGNNSDGQVTVPFGLDNVAAVAAGYYHSMALKRDGTVVAWGYNAFGQATVPAGLTNAVAVTAGLTHTLALKGDGTVVAWGQNNQNQASVPVGLSNVVAIAAGESHSAALVSSPAISSSLPPAILTHPLSQTVPVGSNATFVAAANGTGESGYQWLRNGTALPGASAASLSFTATNRAMGGSYAVVVTNAYGSTTSSPALLRVLVPQRLLAPERLADGRVQLRFGDQDGGLLGAGDAAGFEVYATTNLFATNAWVRLTNSLSLSNGLLHLEEPTAAGLPRRFYRVMER